MEMATLTMKGQATVPVKIRKALHLEPGDHIAFEMMDGRAIVTKVEPFDYHYHQSLSKTLTEWNSAADDEAYKNL
jgi:antitoxin PrlF